MHESNYERLRLPQPIQRNSPPNALVLALVKPTCEPSRAEPRHELRYWGGCTVGPAISVGLFTNERAGLKFSKHALVCSARLCDFAQQGPLYTYTRLPN
jgi:hypothetical protein